MTILSETCTKRILAFLLNRSLYERELSFEITFSFGFTSGEVKSHKESLRDAMQLQRTSRQKYICISFLRFFFLIVDSSWNSPRVLRARQEQATNNRGRTETIREVYCAVLSTYGDDQWNRMAKENGTVHSVLESTALPVSFTMPS